VSAVAASSIADVARPRSAVTARLIVPALVAGAWALLLGAQATGVAAALHHHALIEDGPPLWVAAPLFVAGWLVMVAAMMLPASLPAVRAVERAADPERPPLATVSFLGSFAVVWAVFGLLAFLGDAGFHRVVDATPWLGARPWLIEAGIIALAGAYQFTPRKRRSLASCRHPGDLRAAASMDPAAARFGIRHGLACLGSSWALMLLMFGEGFASLPWMVALTALMVYESIGTHGQRMASAAGLFLIVAAVAVLSGPGV
jgi:predicted metal-binding membrane protein